ncbi:MAG: type II secretion system protein [Phycisphaerales bacterium]
MTSSRPRPGRAFTLLEVLLCLAIILVLIGAMMGFLRQILERRESLVRGTRELQSAGAFIEALESNLLTGLVGGARSGAGIQGTATSLKVLCRGVELPVSSGVDAGDLQGTEFRFEAGAARLTGRHLEGLAGGAGGGTTELVSDRFERVRFRYYDGRGWSDEFDSVKLGRLPAAIEVLVWTTALGNERAPVRGVPAPAAAAVETGEADRGAERAGERAAVEEPAGGENEYAWGPPSRRRVIVVPDGPEANWGAAP